VSGDEPEPEIDKITMHISPEAIGFTDPETGLVPVTLATDAWRRELPKLQAIVAGMDGEHWAVTGSG
jgi:hypothetical protein